MRCKEKETKGSIECITIQQNPCSFFDNSISSETNNIQYADMFGRIWMLQ